MTMKKMNTLIAIAGVMAAGAGLQMPVQRTTALGRNRIAYNPKRDTALQREIADHNEAVERRKAEKNAHNIPAAQEVSNG